jgi:hypothetical protein
MSVKEYAGIAGVSASAISYRVNNRLVLPGIKKYSKVDRVYLLERDNSIRDEDIKLFYRAKLSA